MTGIGLIFLILALICILGGLYFAAWCMCGVQRSRKEGHYILESEEDPDLYNKKLYSGLGKWRLLRSLHKKGDIACWLDKVDAVLATWHIWF